jgi:uncharacterized protein (DUF433 family)
MAVIQNIELISIDPAIRGGQPCIAGTGIRVTDVALAHLFHQRTPDQIASDYELSLAQVHAALAYYYQHKNELDAHIRSQIQNAQTLKEKSGGGRPSLLPR